MAKPHHLNCLIDTELYRALEIHARHAKQPLSESVREVLRHGLGLAPDPRDAGRQAAYNKAYGDLMRAVQEAVARVRAAPGG
jgi:hypothetical protein